MLVRSGVIAGIRPEDIKKDGSIDPDRLYLFDGETHLTLLARDGGYTDTGFAEAAYVPPAFKEEEQIIKKHKPSDKQKKK